MFTSSKRSAPWVQSPTRMFLPLKRHVSQSCPFGKNRFGPVWYTIYHHLPVKGVNLQTPLFSSTNQWEFGTSKKFHIGFYIGFHKIPYCFPANQLTCLSFLAGTGPMKSHNSSGTMDFQYHYTSQVCCPFFVFSCTTKLN